MSATPPLTSDEAPLPRGIPRVLGRYRLLRPLGAGGMGLVFIAVHRLLKQRVALKVIHPNLIAFSNVGERFLKEMAALGPLNHPHIVRAYNAATSDEGLLYLVLELLDGFTLHQLLAAQGPLPVAEVCAMLAQTAQGLDYLHREGVVHRDIKPGNLFLARPGMVKILDLGLARLSFATGRFEVTSPGVALGTADYMAPEQARAAGRVDIRADVYSLGCTFYRLLANRVPFPGEGGLAVKVAAHALEPFPELQRADVDEPVRCLLRRMVAKDPEARPWPSELVADLTNLSREADLTQWFSEPSNEPGALFPATSTIRDRLTSVEAGSTTVSLQESSSPPARAGFPRRAWLAGVLSVGSLANLLIWLLPATPHPESSAPDSATGLRDLDRCQDRGGDLLDVPPLLVVRDGGAEAICAYDAATRELRIVAPTQTLVLFGSTRKRGYNAGLRFDQNVAGPGVFLVLGCDLAAGTFQAVGTAALAGSNDNLAVVRCVGRIVTGAADHARVEIERVVLSEPAAAPPPRSWEVETRVFEHRILQATFGRRLSRLLSPGYTPDAVLTVPSGAIGVLVLGASVSVRQARWTPHPDTLKRALP